ncbi:MAG: hypothetical protein JXR94_02005, partial [Candidatus Hydrogenedentes bacterium]|nr:hypothetical protein [Candidatus Hydrogenedentota bacterium]
LGFTGLILYSWAYHGLADCGCFGDVIPTGPGVSVLKNVIMMAMVGAAWYGHRRRGGAGARPDAGPRGRAARIAVGVAAWGVVVAATAFGGNADFLEPVVAGERLFADFELDFEGQHWALDDGEYLVVILSATCKDCQASVELLNEMSLVEESVRVAGLIYGESEEELEEFRLLTQPVFPTVAIDAITFFGLIDKEPPRFYRVRDGVSLGHIDTLEPDFDTLLAFIHGENGGPASANG